METTTLFIIPPIIYGEVDYYLVRGLIDLLATSLDLYEGISAMAPIMIEVDISGKAKRELQNHFKFLGENYPEEELLEFVEKCYPESGAALLPIMHAQGKNGEMKFTLRIISHSGRYPLFEMHWHGRLLDIIRGLSRDITLVAEHCGGVHRADSKFIWPQTEIEESLKCYLHGLALSKNYQALATGNHYRQALNLLFRALDLDPKMEFAAFRIVGFSEYLLENVDLPTDAYNVGLESLHKLAKQYKLSGRAQIFLAQAFYQQNEVATAEKIFLQALHLHPEDDLVCLEVGTFYEQQGKLEEAHKIYQNYLKRYSQDHLSNPDILLNQGVIYAKQGKLDEAIHYWKQTLKHDPQYGIAFGNLMNAYYDKKDISCMWVFFELGLKAVPVPWKNYENIFQQAGSEQLPDFGPGILYLEEYTKAHPEDSYGYLALAQVLNQLGDREKAKYWAKMAGEYATTGHEKGFAAWQSLCAKIDHFEDELEKIQQDLSSKNEHSIESTLLNWTQEEPHFWQGLYLLGKIYAIKESHEEALKMYLAAWNLVRNLSELAYDVALEYQELKQLDQAKKFCLKAIQINPKNTSYIATLANLYQLTNEKEKAYQCIQRAIALDPKNQKALRMAKSLSRPNRFWKFWKKD